MRTVRGQLPDRGCVPQLGFCRGVPEPIRRLWRASSRIAEDLWAVLERIPTGDEFFRHVLAPALESAARRSLKGTPEILVGHDTYILSIHPDTLAEHRAVLDLYRERLVAEVEARCKNGANAGQQIVFPAKLSIRFESDATVPVGAVRIASSVSQDYAAPAGHPYVNATRRGEASRSPNGRLPRRLRVRWQDTNGTNTLIEIEPPRPGVPLLIGRDAPDPRLRLATSLRTSRQHAMLFCEDACWYLVDGGPDGTPSRHGTTVNDRALAAGQRRRLEVGLVMGFPDRDAAVWIVESC